MSEYTHTLATSGKRDIRVVSDQPVSGTALLEAAYGGKVRFFKVRGTGTLRAWPVLAPGSKERKAAEGYASKVAAKQPVAKVAKEANVSVATMRRTLTSLAFTQGLEAMSAKERAALAKEAVANGKVAATEAPKEPKPEAKPAKGKPAPKEQPAKAERKPRTGKGGFKPETKAGKQAAARKAARTAKAEQPTEEATKSEN